MRLGTSLAAVVLATAASLPLGPASLAAQSAPAAAASSASRATPRAVARTAPRPLDRLTAEHILVLPVRYLTFSDSLAWSAQAPSTSAYLSTLDDEIAFALTERGLGHRWTLAPALARSVARNVDFTADPHALEASELRPGAQLDQWQLREPLASQLRSLVALTDARYVLFPVEARFTPAPGGGRAMLHVVVVDARRAQVQWAGDVWGTPRATLSPAMAAELASRLADLIAAPAN